MLKVFIVFVVAILGILNMVLMSSRKKIAAKIRKNIKEELERERNTPKQIFGMEANLLPILRKMYPDLNVSEFKDRVKDNIKIYLEMKADDKYIDLNATDEFTKVIKGNLKEKEYYKNIKIHDIIIKKYDDKNDRRLLTFQLSIEYFYSKDNIPEEKIQDRFELEYIYTNNEWKLNNLKSV